MTEKRGGLLIEADRPLAGRLDGSTGRVEVADLSHPQVESMTCSTIWATGRNDGRSGAGRSGRTDAGANWTGRHLQALNHPHSH